MNSIDKLLNETLNTDLEKIIISNPRKAGDIVKIKGRPVTIKGKVFFQLEKLTKTQVFHENLEKGQAIATLESHLADFRQMQVYTLSGNYTALISKKGKITINQSPSHSSEKLDENMAHNREKNYILKEGIRVPFLVDTGIMTSEGKVLKSKYHKYRQINRFLEYIDDVLPLLDKNKEVKIIDFGCGKSHLTFAVYYYLAIVKGYDISIVGLDLKESVINNCNELARKYGYDKLSFYVGDIASYKEKVSPFDDSQDLSQSSPERLEQATPANQDQGCFDVVISLHACDTATDYALAKAIKWQAKVILAVPCCQHEINAQLKNDALQPLMKYGLIKERFASLVTDSIRSEYLESMGYQSQILEFIDMEHTPKNIMIRAVKKGAPNYQKRESLRQYENFLHIKPMLGKLLDMEEDDD